MAISAILKRTISLIDEFSGWYEGTDTFEFFQRRVRVLRRGLDEVELGRTKDERKLSLLGSAKDVVSLIEAEMETWDEALRDYHITLAMARELKGDIEIEIDRVSDFSDTMEQ